MDTLFLKLLNRNLSACWLILAVIVLRLLLKKAPKWTVCILWAIVAVRLISPFSLESSWSVIPSSEPIPISYLSSQSSQDPALTADRTAWPVDTGIPVMDHTVTRILTETKSISVLHSNLRIWGGLWILGAFVLLVSALISYFRLRISVREAVCLRDHIWLCDTVSSPFILGVLRPRIYLPSDMEQAQTDYVLAHEQAHLKRLDHWWKPAGFLLLTLHWMNPFVWIAYLLFCRDIELACDEKVVRGLDTAWRKAYSTALLTCSTRRRTALACPLAFGEVDVKERVQKVLYYKKPAFWIVLAAITVCIIVSGCFLTDPKRDTFQIKIVIPANSEEAFYYSEEEISPTGKRITLSLGEGSEDTAVVLKLAETTENAGSRKESSQESSAPTYMTPGFPAKMEVQKGDWYQIGIIASNPTQEDQIVWIQAKGVNVRITCTAEIPGTNMTDPGLSDDLDMEQSGTSPIQEPVEKEGNLSSNLEITFSGSREGSLDLESSAAIYAAILEQNASPYPEDYDFVCCDFYLLETLSATPAAGSTTHQITYYGWELYQEYAISQNGIREVSGSHVPIALTFELDQEGYHLKEYWQPRDGSYFVPDVREKFPSQVAEDGIDSQKYGLLQKQNCYRQAVLYSGLDVDAVIGTLLDTICMDPKTSSAPRDYLDAHPAACHELLYYGEYTLAYCFDRFAQGSETGLDGTVMALICEELLQMKGKLPVDAATAQTGQLWYDTLIAHSGNPLEP